MSKPFLRVQVDNMIRGTTRVTWQFARHFLDPSPELWSYTLQVSKHGLLPTYQNNALRSDDWTNVGAAVVNAGQLTDSTQRAYGKNLTTSYRIRLVTPVGTYYSDPAPTQGDLSKEDWLRAREILRKETLLHRRATSMEGFLLRRRHTGTPCTLCLDLATKEILVSSCSVCKGTRFVDGYFPAISGIWCRLENYKTREEISTQAVGSQMQLSTQARISGIPGVESLDVWIDPKSDLRYFVHVTEVAAAIRNIPLIYQVELRQAPFDDVVYRISLS